MMLYLLFLAITWTALILVISKIDAILTDKLLQSLEKESSQ